MSNEVVVVYTAGLSAGHKIGIFLAFLLGFFIVYFGYKMYTPKSRR